MFAGAYQGKKVLVTGHTGFKGSWLCTWLLELGAEVAGYSLSIPTQPANFEVLGLKQQIQHYNGDLRHRDRLFEVMNDFYPDLVFHLGAQSLVRHSYQNPAITFETNTLGTMNLLECLRHQPSVSAAVIITSDKCYRNQEWIWGYRENDNLGGDDPYSASKACAELICHSYTTSFFNKDRPVIATARAGNVIGGGDWAPDRLVPDCIRAWSAGQTVKVRNPQATRPWQHVLEPISGYLWLGARLFAENSLAGESINFGPPAVVNQSVGDLLEIITQQWPGASWELEFKKQEQQPESNLLKLCCDKALNLLQWRAILSFQDTIRMTIDWYRHYYESASEDMYLLSRQQIFKYQDLAKKEGLPWALT